MAAVEKAIGAHGLRELLGNWRQGGGSAYRMLAMSVRALVLDGRVAAESRLPAERELATALTVSRTTVAASYELLRTQGFLTSRRGAGSFVVRPKGGLEPGGGRVIDLTAAAMSAPEPWLSRAMDAAVAELPRYARTHGDFPAGLQVLRAAIAARYEQRGLPTTAEQIIVTSGATGAFTLLLRELTVPADRVAVESPGHPNLLRALSLTGAGPVPVRMPDDGWDTGDWAGVFRTAAPRLAFVSPDFHSPTGLLMSGEQRRELVSLSRSTGVTLLVDETMAELSLDPGTAMPLPLAAHGASGMGGTVITVGSAGKTFWGGLRIGWIRATPELVRRLAARRAGLDIGSPVVEQLAVAQLLSGEAVLTQVLSHQRDRVRSRREALVAALRRELPDWTFRVPGGGLALWVRTGGESASVLAAAAARMGVRLAAGPCHGTDGFLEEFVRLPFTQPPEVITEAVRRIGAARKTGRSDTVAHHAAPAVL
ncbi:MocR-like transcription factor YczR [Streptomyces sp. NBC_00344]|uniref:MocR-like transcription factor YczR n=1 Tax=Streptomyces sp. NBC_00344 TaxID=2975720 RepID=UPI002E1D85A6